MMADSAPDNLSAADEALQAYWDEIDQDPAVQERREAFRIAVQEGRVPEGAVYPSDYLRERGGRLTG
jgi:hypothetical protein